MNRKLPPWLPVVICLVISVYLLILFHSTTDLSNIQTVPPIHYVILFLGVLLPLVPFVSRLRLGKLIELERDVRETKGEVQDFKSEIRQMFSIVSTSINSISNFTNTTNVNIDLAELLRQARDQLEQEGPQERQDVEEIKEELLLEDEDTVMALARTRIRLEYLLRKILGKRTHTGDSSSDIKFMAAGRLYRLFLRHYPQYRYLESSFEYVLRMCNAAIHGQTVPYGQAQEALDIGARLISTLDDVPANNDLP